MSTTIIEGSPTGEDEASGLYRNLVQTDRAVWWEAAGARQGVKRGFALTTVGGQMALEVSAGLGFVEERDVSGSTGTHRGYAVWSDSTEVVSFDPASASDRNDAVVFAFVDVTVGAAALGTGTSQVGGQLVVVPGVSGVTTPRTDTQISDYVGSGGWCRLADVLVESTDTEIQAANITLAAASALKPVASVSNAPGQSIPDNSSTVVALPTTDVLDGPIRHVGNTVVIDQPGPYALAGVVRMQAGTGRMWVGLRVNGSFVTMDSTDNAGVAACSCTIVKALTAGDVIDMQVFHATGGAQQTSVVAPTLSVELAR